MQNSQISVVPRGRKKMAQGKVFGHRASRAQSVAQGRSGVAEQEQERQEHEQERQEQEQERQEQEQERQEQEQERQETLT